VLDLDNTLWGGIVGEEGLDGIRLGDTPEGEAFQAFQESILALQRRGIVLAVCSKNNDADAREVFERHPAMRIGLDDVAVFVADWRSKPEQLRTVAETLGIGLDALVFVDDSPAEREAVRRLAPEVDVIPLPQEPSDYVAALGDYLLFEPPSFTADDERRTEQYRGRREAVAAASSADSIEDFYRSLEMQALVSPFTDADLPRIAQLVGKTNQFNLTTRRHSAAALEAFARDPECVHLAFRLSDRFTDHGLVALVVAFERDDVLDVDTWLMSCRVIGRTLEETVLQELCRGAFDRACSAIQGTYVPSPKNELVRDLYRRLGFEPLDESDGTTRWRYDVAKNGAIANDFIDVTRAGDAGA
jgi:FkbH-like protein